jgi:hypothetical protein
MREGLGQCHLPNLLLIFNLLVEGCSLSIEKVVSERALEGFSTVEIEKCSLATIFVFTLVFESVGVFIDSFSIL